MMNTLGGIIGFFLMDKLAKFLLTREVIDKKMKETSQVVSGFRRITLFCLDFTLFTIFSVFYILLKVKKCFMINPQP